MTGSTAFLLTKHETQEIWREIEERSFAFLIPGSQLDIFPLGSARELCETFGINSFNDALARSCFIIQLGFKAPAIGVHYIGHMGRLGFENGELLLLASMKVIRLWFIQSSRLNCEDLGCKGKRQTVSRWSRHQGAADWHKEKRQRPPLTERSLSSPPIVGPRTPFTSTEGGAPLDTCKVTD